MKRAALFLARLRHRLFWLPALVVAALGFRMIRVTHPDRVGHLIGETDCLLRETRLGRLRAYRGILLAPSIANTHLAEYLACFVVVVRSPWLCKLLGPIGNYPFAQYCEYIDTYFSAIDKTARYNEIFSAWSGRPPIFELSQADLDRGRRALAELGIPDGARFVSFHARSAGYSPSDEHLHSFRNASVESFLPALRALRDRGLYSVRMGDPTVPRLPPLEGVIDYAHSPQRSEWMDVYLCARCEFFLGNTSGLHLISTAFGRPSALTNLVPTSMAFSGGARELGIPKLLWKRDESRFMRFAEVLGSPLADARFTSTFDAAGVQVRENEPEEIRDFALEMLDRLEGRARYEASDEARQEHFRSMYKPGHYGYGSKARVGRDFLRKYAHLLDH